VLRSLETTQISGKVVKEILDPGKTLLFTDDEAKKIHILHGEKSPLIFYFIAHRLAKEIRKFTRGFYHAQEIRLSELTPAFLEIQAEFQGKIPEVVNPSAHGDVEGGNVIRSGEKIYLDQDSAWRDRLTHENIVVFSEGKSNEILEEVQGIPLSEEHSRNLVIIGPDIYTPAWKLAHFISERQIVPYFQFIGTLPEGKFYYPDLTPRIVVKKGKIQAIELLSPHDNTPSRFASRQIGVIPAPVLFIPRIVHERNIHNLKMAFKMPPVGLTESLESLLDEKK